VDSLVVVPVSCLGGVVVVERVVFVVTVVILWLVDGVVVAVVSCLFGVVVKVGLSISTGSPVDQKRNQ